MTNGYMIIADNGWNPCYIMSNWEDFCMCGSEDKEDAHIFDLKDDAQAVIDFFEDKEKNDGLVAQDYKIVAV